MKFFKKNMSHSLLAALLVLFIVLDIKIPYQAAKLANTLLGRIIVAGGALGLLMNNQLLLFNCISKNDSGIIDSDYFFNQISS